MNGGPEIHIARLEVRADNADADIAELKADAKAMRDEIGALRRLIATVGGAAGVLSSLMTLALNKLFGGH
ncbi:MAG: hypothetical protein ACK4RV_10125 [Caulobacter sp.]